MSLAAVGVSSVALENQSKRQSHPGGRQLNLSTQPNLKRKQHQLHRAIKLKLMIIANNYKIKIRNF